jgi:CRISPR/Cas system-associated exonuclease Cas4 (RecB family)
MSLAKKTTLFNIADGTHSIISFTFILLAIDLCSVTKTIIDLKTTKSINWQRKHGFIPNPEHILQVQVYDSIFSQILPIEDLNLLYADESTMVAYRIQRRNLEQWIKTRIQEIEDSLFDDDVPIGEVSGICKYCKFQTRCYNDRNGLTTKPLSRPRRRSPTSEPDKEVAEL